MPLPLPNDGFVRLVVRNADAAIGFVQDALAGTLVERFAETDGRVVHSRLSLGSLDVSIVEEVPEWGWLAPPSLGGSPVLVHLGFDDCDAVADRMVALGAEVVIPIKDRPYGKREGRLCDPFGQLWVLSQELAE
jgi:uncharacterized glyoxalase superfamily protein PhnB